MNRPASDHDEAVIDGARATFLDREETTARREAGIETLVAHLDTEAILDAMDDERIHEYLDERIERAAGEP